MTKENDYDKKLNLLEIALGRHRSWVGGKWDTVGPLQIEFMKTQGLLAHHTLLDIGCGCFRGGQYFIDYLDRGNYYGIDINASILNAGLGDLKKAGRLLKQPHTLINGNFEFHKFNVTFDFAVAISVFTHINLNHIGRCLVELRKVLKPKGVAFISFFQADHPIQISESRKRAGLRTTHYDSDPYHYSFEEIAWMATNADLHVELIEDWNHPGNQGMLKFTNVS